MTRSDDVRGARHVTSGRDAMDDFLSRIGRVQLLTADEERSLAVEVRAGIAAKASLEATRSTTSEASSEAVDEPDVHVDPLDPAEQRRLQRVVALGDRARRQFVEANLRLVVSIARTYRTPGVDLSDLVQEGNVGLLRAVERFDPSFGVRFSTYATYWIRQAVRHGLSKLGHAISLPDEKRAQLAEARRADEHLTQLLGRAPSDDEIAADMGLTPDALAQLRRSELRVVSANVPVGEEGELELLELLAPTASAGDDEIDRSAVSEALALAMADLRPRDREILLLRFGFATGRVETLEEVARHYNITRERVRQLEMQAVSVLRRGTSAAALLDAIRDG
jgi:RNA polymerase sigma factor (sigma-70 family)